MNTQTTAVLETIDWQQRAEQAEAALKQKTQASRDAFVSVANALTEAQDSEDWNLVYGIWNNIRNGLLGEYSEAPLATTLFICSCGAALDMRNNPQQCECLREHGDHAQPATDLPWLQPTTVVRCSACGNSGWSNWNEQCVSCNGSGKEADAQVDVLLSKRALKTLSFGERVSLCDEAGVHFSCLEAILGQPGKQQSSLTAAAFSQIVQLAVEHHESVAKVLKGGEVA